MLDVDGLRFAESDFLTALESGSKTLASHRQTWTTLLDELSSLSENDATSKETLSLIYFVASRISNVASCYLDIAYEEESFASQLRNDCDTMLNQMNALTFNVPAKPSASDTSPTSASNIESFFPPFLSLAHQWLLDNLHNPYPTAEVKARIATTSSCHLSSINSWFINARRRIGWTTLCQERFSNCRADMVDAAYRALVKEDPKRMLPPDLRHAFVTMKVTTENLYSSTRARSTFTGDSDAIVKDITNGGDRSVQIGRCHQVEQANLSKAVLDSYPTPDGSTTPPTASALENSLVNEGGEGDGALLVVAGSKRRRSFIEPVESCVTARSIKRLRTSLLCLPSPPSSAVGGDVLSDSSLSAPLLTHSTPPQMSELPSFHKQHLFNANSSGIQQQPGSLITPHHGIVSDPLPCSNMENENSIDDWFNSNIDTLFTMPPPVDATETDFSASWEVELFRDYSIPGEPNYAFKPLSDPIADSHLLAGTNLSDLGNLLRPVGSNTFLTPLENVPLSDSSGKPYATSLGIPDMLQSDTDWLSLLNDSDSYQSVVHSTFHQYLQDTQPSPEIDLFMLQLPHVIPPTDTEGTFASKQAKLNQLHAMQEAVRRMEEELQFEGVIM